MPSLNAHYYIASSYLSAVFVNTRRV